MRERLANLDRRIAVAAAVMAASTLLLAIGLASIFLALGNDAGLPNEGSLQEILQAHEGQLYQVPPLGQPDGPAPVRISIPELSVDAPVLAISKDSKGRPEVPDTGSDVGWYDFTSPPGLGGNAVFSGHVDWFYWGKPGEGVFYHLRELKIGDEVVVALEDGNALRYRVTGNVAVPYNDPNVVTVMQPTRSDVITLITCGGQWLKDFSNPNGGNYSHRVVVRAERERDLAAAGDGSGG